MGSAKNRIIEFAKHCNGQYGRQMANGMHQLSSQTMKLFSWHDLYQLFYTGNRNIVIFDESHRIKNPSSVKAKKAFKVVGHSGGGSFATPTHVYLLSGTPVLNSPLDIFQQFKVMDGGATFGDNYFAFPGPLLL